MKNFNNGFCLGKFAPLHNGHLHLFDEALKLCDHLTIFVCSIEREVIPGETRYQWVKETFRDNINVSVIHITEDLPQSETENPNCNQIWASALKSWLPDADVMVSSEIYGNDVAKLMEIQHHCVDINRNKIQISATMIRSNPMKYWDFMPRVVQKYFTKRIAFMGPESSGKSQLSLKMSEKFHTSYASEYGRDYLQTVKEWAPSCFVDIAKHQIEKEEVALNEANKIFFCDTELVTTNVFMNLYCLGDYSFELENLIDERKYDLRIVLDCNEITCQDGTREFLDRRTTSLKMICNELDCRGLPYIIASGNYNEIEKIVTKEVKKLLNFSINLYK